MPVMPMLQHSCFQGLKLGFLADDLHLGELGGGAVGSVEGGDTLDGNGLGGGHTASDGHGGVGLHGGGIRQHSEAGIGGEQAVLGDIQTGDFFLRRDPQADGVLQDGEDDGDDHSHIEDYGSNAQALDAKEVEATAVEQPPFSVDTPVAKRPVRIVPRAPQTPWTEMAPTGSSILATLSKNSTASTMTMTEDDAHNGGTQRGYSVTPGGDAHQARQSGVVGHGDIGLAVAQPGEDQGGAAGHGSCRGWC